MKRSEQIGELVAALAKAQSEFTPALKDSDNPYYQSKYADLASVINAIRPALSKNGIAMIHSLESDLERQCAIVTVGLYHGEQFLEVTVEAPATGRAKKDERNEGMAATKFDVQTIGAAWSYLRRYTLQAICGLASEDDDGNSLQGDNKPIVKRTTPAQATHPVGQRQDQGLFRLLPPDNDELVCTVLGVVEKKTKPADGKTESKPYLVVTVNGFLHPQCDPDNPNINAVFCYDAKLFDAVKNGVTKQCHLKLDLTGKFVKLVDVCFIDGTEYKDGKPVIQGA